MADDKENATPTTASLARRLLALQQQRLPLPQPPPQQTPQGLSGNAAKDAATTTTTTAAPRANLLDNNATSLRGAVFPTAVPAAAFPTPASSRAAALAAAPATAAPRSRHAPVNTQSQTAHLAERISRLTAQEASPAAHLARRIRALQRYTPSLSYKTQPTPSPSLTSDCPRTAFDHVRRGLDGATPSRAALYKYPSLFDVPATPKPTARRDLGRLFDDLDDTAPLDAMVLPAESLDDTADLDAGLVTTPRSRHRRSRSATPVATPLPGFDTVNVSIASSPISTRFAPLVSTTSFGRVTIDRAEIIAALCDYPDRMSDAQLASLFTAFTQADTSTTRRYGGTGLGLAISQRLATLLGGRISVVSAPGKGSTFELRIPLIGAEIPAPAPVQAEHARRLQGLRILVAEDNEINQMIVADLLTDEGADIVLVDDGAAALAKVCADPVPAFDLVLMDIQMPVMDGFEATRAILRHRPQLPVIGQTAHTMEDEIARCLEAGMVGHLAKPLDPDATVREIRRHLIGAADTPA